MECPAYTLTSGGLQQRLTMRWSHKHRGCLWLRCHSAGAKLHYCLQTAPPCNDDIPHTTIPTAGGLLALQAYIALCYALSGALQRPGLVSAAQRCGCAGDFVCLDIIDEGGVADAIHERHPLEAISCLRRVLQALQAVRQSVNRCKTLGNMAAFRKAWLGQAAICPQGHAAWIDNSRYIGLSCQRKTAASRTTIRSPLRNMDKAHDQMRTFM
jgi:hypothetical protein